MLQRQGPGFDSERAIVQLTTTSGPKARFGGFDILIFIEIVRFITKPCILIGFYRSSTIWRFGTPLFLSKSYVLY